MSKQLLIERKVGSLSLSEEVQNQAPRKGILGTLKGVCADYKNKTRNGNFYSRKLWENAFNDPIIKESLEDRILIGELDHPGTRLETKATNACIIMTDYEFDDNNGKLLGTFDILDTPNGQILKTLLDAGCKIGVSSRGEGDITEGLSESGETSSCVDPNTFTFVGFDAVVLPAVKEAKPIMQESFKRGTLRESLSNQVSSAKNREELEVIKNIIETAELPDSDSLLESINIKSKELEGATGSSNLLEDLERANTKLESSELEVKKLKEALTTCRTRVSKLTESRNQLANDVDVQKKQNDTLKKRTESYSSKVKSLNKQISTLQESKAILERKEKTLKSDLSLEKSKYDKLEEENKKLRSSLRESQSYSKELVDQLKEAENKTSSLERKLVNESTKSSRELNSTKDQANKSIVELKKANKALKESYSSVIREYAKTQAKFAGIDSKLVLESLTNTSTVSDVKQLVESIRDRLDRYSSLPISNNSITRASSVTFNDNKLSESDAQSRDFMQLVFGVKD